MQDKINIKITKKLIAFSLCCFVVVQYTYTPLIHAYTKTYQWEPAQVVLERVIEEKVKLSSSLPYGHLIRCFRVTKKFDAMERAYTAMVAEGYEVPEISWEIALEGFALGGKMVSHR